MRRLLLVLLVGLGVLAVGCSAADDDNPFGLVLASSDGGTSAEPVVLQGTLKQAVDHHAPDGPSFEQHYLVESDHAPSMDAPVLLYIGGESALTAASMPDLTDVAAYLGAHVVALEHRYYGESVPPEADSTPFAHLTVENAVEDLATFVRYTHTQLKLTGKVFAVGGSYAGTLAAALRTAHPELVRGAWASSAPMKLAPTYPDYDRIASAALGDTCTKAVQAAYAAATVAFADDTKRDAIVNRYYGADYPFATLSAMLLSWSSGVSSAAQYGNEHHLCASLAQYPDSPLDGLLLALSPPYLMPQAQAQAQAAALRALVAGGHTPRPDDSDSTTGMSARDGATWGWQVCTELGLFTVPNPDRAHSTMYAGDDAAYAAQTCAAIGATTTPDVAKVRAAYVDPIVAGRVTSIFFTNGSLDPWSGASFLDAAELPADKDLSVMVLAEASHCEDLGTFVSITGVPVGLPAAFEAHQRFATLVKGWLSTP